MENMTEKEIQEAIGNLKLERIKCHSISDKVIPQWKFKTSLNEAEIDLDDAEAFIKINNKNYLNEGKEDTLQIIECSNK
jgi:hypothetical protein